MLDCMTLTDPSKRPAVGNSGSSADRDSWLCGKDRVQLVVKQDEMVMEWNSKEVEMDKMGCTLRIKSVSRFTSGTRSPSRVYTHRHHVWRTPLRLDRYCRQMPRNDGLKTCPIFLRFSCLTWTPRSKLRPPMTLLVSDIYVDSL